MSTNDELVTLFTSIGLTQSKANDTIKNTVLSESLKSAIEEVSLSLKLLNYNLLGYENI